LIHALKLWRERGGSDYLVARTLKRLAGVNWVLGLLEEGIQQAKEVSDIFERRGDVAEQAACLALLGNLFIADNQPDAAEEATMQSINLLGKGQEYQLCDFHRILGNIFCSKGEREKAIHHFNISLEIAAAFNWPDLLFWTHDSLVKLFRDEDKFDDAHAHIKQAKEHALDNKYFLGRAMEQHSRIWYRQGRHEEAVSEVKCAIEIYGKLGAARDLEDCKDLLRRIERAIIKS